MNRLALAIAATYVALAQPGVVLAHASQPVRAAEHSSAFGSALDQPARAAGSIDSPPSAPSMCADNAQPMSPMSLVLMEALASGRPLVHDGAAMLPARPRPDDSQPAWCISPDDPRCAPRDTGAPLQSERWTAGACAFVVSSVALARYDEAAAGMLQAQPGSVRPGFSSGLERPPRHMSA